MWTCPNCHRVFKTKNQWHSCVQIKPEDLLTNKPAEVKQLYDHLCHICKELGSISIDTTKSCIYFMDTHRFLAIKPKKDGLILEFILNRREDIFPVINIFAMSKYQYVHRLKIDTMEELEGQVFSWIKEAYELKTNQ